jgi:hypothetical protein
MPEQGKAMRKVTATWIVLMVPLLLGYLAGRQMADRIARWFRKERA